MGERSLTHRAEEFSSPDAWILSKFEWDVFGTLTFEDPIPPLSVIDKCGAEFIRRVAKHIYEVSNPNKYIWAMRYELGEKTGRPHFHFLTAPPRGAKRKNKKILAKQMEHIWYQEVRKRVSKKYGPCVGFPKIRPYDSLKAGASYICKPAYSARDFYELSKFKDGFERHAEHDGARVSLGSLLLLEIAKYRNRSNKVPGFARFLRELKQRNVAAKSGPKDKKYHILPDQTSLVHPADDTACRTYC